jgi:phosphoserine phosphatase
MIVAFDVDLTLTNYDNSPNYEVIDILRWFLRNGDRVIIWSGGGFDYAKSCAERLGLYGLKNVMCSMKHLPAAQKLKVDIAFDDEFVQLGKVNIKINNLTKK